jgi:alpha-D-ribose 1-methylphosphonate 5-triphosphate diphosphatase PhnM
MLDMTRPSIKLISVRNACMNAPPSPRKYEALEHYVAALKARRAMREADSNCELDAATRALTGPA